MIPATVAAGRIAKVNAVHKTPAALADKPGGELKNTNALVLAGVAVISVRRATEVVTAVEIELVVLGEPVSKTALFDRVDSKRCVPGIEAANDDGVLDEVDHRTSSVDANEMRFANVAIRPALGLACLFRATESGHQSRPFLETPGCANQRCTLGSTSRMEVGAQNFSSPGSGSSGGFRAR